MLADIQIGDTVHMRKPHPCGGSLWLVTRLGADIGLECQTCQRRVMLSRRELNRRAKSIATNAENTAQNAIKSSDPEAAMD